MPGMGEYMAMQGMGGQQPPDPMAQQAPPQGPASLGNMDGETLQPEYGSQEAEKTPLNDQLYSGGEFTQMWKRILIERAQARAAASAQYQRGQLQQNENM